MHRIKDYAADFAATHRHLLILLSILLLASFLRLWQLGALPLGLLSSEASLSLQAQDLASYPVEISLSLFVYAQALAVNILEPSALTVRVVTAAVSILTVITTYMAAKVWLGERTALLAAFFMAVSTWALHLGRIAEPINWWLWLLPLHAWLWHRSLATDRSVWYVFTGISLGLLVYTPVPVWVVVVAVIAVWVYFLRLHRLQLQRHVQQLLIVVSSAALTLTPALLYLLITGDMGFLQSEVAVVEQLSKLWQDPAAAANAAVATLGMFHFQGSLDPAYNVPGQPQLDLGTGVFMVLGGLVVVRRWKQPVYGTLLVVAGALIASILLISVTAPDPVSAALTLPVVVLLAAIGVHELIRRWLGVFPRNIVARWFGAVFIAVTLAMVALYSWQHYFVAWANTPEAIATYDEAAVVVAEHIERQPEHAVIVIYEEEQQPIYEYMLGDRDKEVELVSTAHAEAADLEQFEQVYDVTSHGAAIEEATHLDTLESRLIAGEELVRIYTY